MTDQQTIAADDRIERAARTLAYFEGSDVFDRIDTAEANVGRDVYRSRAAALLARTVPLAERPTTQRQERTPPTRPDPILALSFNRQITSAKLAALSPGEITALFRALSTIATITAKPTGGTA